MATSANIFVPRKAFSRCYELPGDINLLHSPTCCSTSATLSSLGSTALCSGPGNRCLSSKEQLSWRLHVQEPVNLVRRARTGGPLVVEAAKKVRSARSLLLSSTLIAEDGKVQQVVDMCKRIVDWGREKQKEQNSGVIQFDCYVDTFEKNVYHFMEVYDSFQSMSMCRASEEHQKFVKDVRPFLKQPIALVAYEHKEGQIGHAMNPIGPKGEGGLDDATGQASLGSKSKKNQDDSPGDSNGAAKPTDDSSASTNEAPAAEEGNFFVTLKKLFAGRK